MVELGTFTAKGEGSISGQGTKIPQASRRVAQKRGAGGREDAIKH